MVLPVRAQRNADRNGERGRFGTGEGNAVTLGHQKSFEHIDEVLGAVASLRKAVNHHENEWHWGKLRMYAAALFDRAPFKVGSRVRMTKTPVINEKEAWGWLGAKHFLVAGAIGTVQAIDFDDGHFCAWVTWDNETWHLGFDRKLHVPTPDERKWFMHWDTQIEAIPIASDARSGEGTGGQNG